MVTNAQTGDPNGGIVLTTDERAAARAFVARAEVRLSTFHRIAVGMLSGAGLLVVLPVVVRDSVTGILRALLAGPLEVSDLLLTVAFAAVIAVPAVALWMLFADLTRFYFHANHLGGVGGDLFTPRFTLTSLRLPSDELGPEAADALAQVRTDPRNVELLVPTNEASRRRIDRQLTVYGGLGSADDDNGRAAGLFDLAASRSRALLEEVAKVEYGMARHVLKLRGLVLRYVKALLAVLTTALAVYCGDAVVADVGNDVGVRGPEAVWLGAVVLAWAPLVVLAVTSPVRWIENLMRADGAPETAVADDPELTLIERVSLRIAAIGWIAAALALLIGAFDQDASSTQRGVGLGLVVVSLGAVVAAVLTGRFRSLASLRASPPQGGDGDATGGV